MKFLPKAVAAIGIAFLCFAIFLLSDYIRFSGAQRPSAAILWAFIISGWALSIGGVVAAALQHSGMARRKFALALFVLGVALFAAGIFLARAGFVLLLFGVPALFSSAAVGMSSLGLRRAPERQ